MAFKKRGYRHGHLFVWNPTWGNAYLAYIYIYSCKESTEIEYLKTWAVVCVSFQSPVITSQWERKMLLTSNQGWLNMCYKDGGVKSLQAPLYSKNIHF